MLLFYLKYNPVDNDQAETIWNGAVDVLETSWSKQISLQRRHFGFVAESSSPLVPLAVLKEATAIIKELSGNEAGTANTATMIMDTGSLQNLVSRVEGEYKNLKKPWELYVSAAALDEISLELDRSVKLSFEELPESRYGLLLFDENEHFLFSKSLIRGDEPPCFYCGSRKHSAVICPSKQLFSAHDSAETAGHFSLSHVNDCFLTYLTSPGNHADSPAGGTSSDGKDERIRRAHQAFYDVKKIFQLRFFSLFFGTDRLDWERIRHSRGQHGEGGPTWLALDCLRVGDVERAKHYVGIGIERDPGDWRSYCLFGFIEAEKGHLGKAEDFFEKALDLCRRIPQRILVNLLISRIHYLNDQARKAREHARAALTLDRWCYDALYQLIVLDLTLTGNELPLRDLDRLVRHNGSYWINAFIDPDLVPFSADIHPCLSRIASEARHESEILWREAQRQFRGVETLVGADSRIIREAKDILNDMDRPNRGGYLDCAEKMNAARMLTSLCRKALDEQKEGLKRLLAALKSRIDGLYGLVSASGDKPPTKCMEALSMLKSRIETVRRSAAVDFVNTYQSIVAQQSVYTMELNEIERDLKMWNAKKQLNSFLIRFLIRTSGFLFLTFTFVLLLPILLSYAQGYVPDWVVAFNDYPQAHRLFIVFGVFTSLVAAGASSYSKTYGMKRERSLVETKATTKPVKKQARA